MEDILFNNTNQFSLSGGLPLAGNDFSSGLLDNNSNAGAALMAGGISSGFEQPLTMPVQEISQSGLGLDENFNSVFSNNLEAATESSNIDPLTGTALESSPSDQPLVGVIDTGFSTNNPDIDYSRMILGRDRIDGDDNPLVTEGVDAEHGTQVLDIIGATQDNGIGINGINDDAPLWVGRAVGSGKWAESLVEFVDAAKTSGQPNAVINLSFDLIQTNPDGSVTTRYELTWQERSALEYARQNGILIVAAAGNKGGTMSALGQASQEFDNIVTVGAADDLDRANYSSYGNGLTLLASDDGAGTSLATAKVTGTISQMWAANPELNYHQVIDILKSTATDLNAPGWDAETGAGLVNIKDAVSTAAKTTPVLYDTPVGIMPQNWTIQMAENNALEHPAGLLGDIWGGIKDFGGGIWGGIKSGSKWLYNQADDKLIGAFDRTIEWVKKTPSKLQRLGNDYVNLVKAVGKGDLTGAAKAYGRIFVDYAEIAGVPESLETLANWVKLNTRPLNSHEIEIAKRVFGDSINYSLVRVDEASLLVGGRKLLTGGDDAPFTTFNTINSLGKIKDDETLIHELTHVWQYQHHGAIYIPEAVGAQITEGRNGAYDYQGVSGLQKHMVDGKGLFSFNREQQGNIVEDYYRIKYDGNETNDIYLSLYANFVKQVSTLSEDTLGMLPTDSGNTLSTARNLYLSQTNGALTLREFVGNFSLSLPFVGQININDEADFFRLNVTRGNLNLALTGMTADADMWVIQDVNRNGIVDAHEIIGSSTLSGSQNEAINLTGLASGEYFVKVYPFGGSRTNYKLSVST